MKPSQARKGQNSLASFVTDANNILETLYGRIDSETNRNFGSDMLLGLRANIPAITIAHRILKKFQRPIKGHRQALRQACFAQWVGHEESLRGFSFDAIPSADRSVLYRASAVLHSWFRDFKPAKSLVEFTPGESFHSMNGKVSIYQKLSTKECWTVTPDAMDDFIRLVYNNISLKRCAKAFMPKLTRSQHRRLYEAYKTAPHVGYACFYHMMKHFVVTLVHGSRASSVYKNNDEERFINVEPLGNMILQRQVAQPVREILKSVGNDLELGQAIHKIRIALSRIATIDFSKASDSVILAVVLRLFPRSITKYLIRYRSPFVLVGDCWYEPRKLSSMGCGFTFEIMSALLCAIARVFDASATVYGDDVIISNDGAQGFISAAESIGFKVNKRKTFVDSPFRESCGAFYLDGYGYIKCFDLHWLEHPKDVVIAINKLWIIIEDARLKEHSLHSAYCEAYEALLRITPALLRGYTSDLTEPDSGFAQDPKARRKHMRSEEVTTLRKRYQPVIDYLCGRHGFCATDVLVVRSYVYSPRLASKTERTVKPSGARLASYLHAGMVVDDVIRNCGGYVPKLLLVHSSGVFSLREAQLQMSKEMAADAKRLQSWLETRHIFGVWNDPTAAA